MHVHRAFRPAGGAGGVEPERHVVGDRRRGVIVRLVGADDVLEQPVAVRVVARDDDVLEIGAILDRLLEFREQRLRHHQAFGAAVGEHEAVVVLGEQRVDRHRDDAALQAAEKSDRPVDGIEHHDHHALFAPDAEPAQRGAETRRPVGELAIGDRAPAVDIGRLVGAAGGEIRLQYVGGEIVVAWDCAHAGGRACFLRLKFGDCHLFSSRDGAYYAPARKLLPSAAYFAPPDRCARSCRAEPRSRPREPFS